MGVQMQQFLPPRLEAPFENGVWRKVRSLREGRQGTKYILAVNQKPEVCRLPTGLPFVVKRSDKTKVSMDRSIREARSALCVQRRCANSACTGKVYGIWQDDRYVYTASEYCSNGDLYTWWTQKGSQDTELRSVTKKVLSAVNDLHTASVAHMNLQPEAFHVAADGTVKIVDFERANDVAAVGLQEAKKIVSEVVRETRQWQLLPPELLTVEAGVEQSQIPAQHKQEGFDASKLDSYQVGVLLLTLAVEFQDLPWYNRSKCEEVARDGLLACYDANRTSSSSGSLPEGARLLLEKLLAPQPDDRITVSEALEDPWLQF